MEAAKRVFAGEFNLSNHISESEGSPGRVNIITPSGARCTRVFLVGACTEVRESSGGLRLRVADPTGAFHLFAGREYPLVFNIIKEIKPPEFIAVRGDIQRIVNKGSQILAVRPESVAVVDRAVRDLWVLRTVEITIQRLETLYEVLHQQRRERTMELAVQHYQTDDTRIREIALMVNSALRTVKTQPDTHHLPLDPSSTIISILRENSGSRGMSIEQIRNQGIRRGLGEVTLDKVIAELLAEGDCYTPSTGYIKLL